MWVTQALLEGGPHGRRGGLAPFLVVSLVTATHSRSVSIQVGIREVGTSQPKAERQVLTLQCIYHPFLVDLKHKSRELKAPGCHPARGAQCSRGLGRAAEFPPF